MSFLLRLNLASYSSSLSSRGGYFLSIAAFVTLPFLGVRIQLMADVGGSDKTFSLLHCLGIGFNLIFQKLKLQFGSFYAVY